MKNNTTHSPNALVDDSVARFLNGFNCCQAVFGTFGPSLGMDRDKALQTAEAFGGSVMGKTCGAVSGALMTIGLKYGRTADNQKENKNRTKQLAQEFIRQFKSRNDSVVCSELLGHDISTPDGAETVARLELTKTRCPDFVRDAAQILEQLI